MKERETRQPSIWEKLTPYEALGLAERILCGIENGKFPRGIYEPIVERLIEFACGDKNSNNSSESQVGQNTVLKNKDQKPPKNNKTPHSLGLSQLPTAQRTLYRKRQAVLRDIFEANKDGKQRVKNRGKKY